jgi:hypothetical protein
VFLDATTFFHENWIWKLRDAKAAWRVAHETKQERRIWQTLVALSLVYDVGEDESIRVHEQLQSLGRKIASEQRQDITTDDPDRLSSLLDANGSDLKVTPQDIPPYAHVHCNQALRASIVFEQILDSFAAHIRWRFSF